MRHCCSFRAKTKQFRVCCTRWVIASFELMYWDPSYALIPPENNLENENLPHLHKKHKQKSSYATSRCRVAHSIVVDFAQPLSKLYCWLSYACMRITHQIWWMAQEHVLSKKHVLNIWERIFQQFGLFFMFFFVFFFLTFCIAMSK